MSKFEHFNEIELSRELKQCFNEYKTGNDSLKLYVADLYQDYKNRDLDRSNLLDKGYIMGLENLVASNGSRSAVTDNNIKEEIKEKMRKKRDEASKNREMITKADPTVALSGLAMWIEQIAKSGIDEDKVREIVRESVEALAPRQLEVKVGEVVTKIAGRTHFYFPLVLKVVASGVNVALSGSTATSKTTMATQSAKSLGRGYYIQPMNDGTTKSDIMGYMSASGEYIQSSFYRAMTEGAIYIAEEIDSGSPACLLVLNNAVDNRECTFPNGETVQAKDGFQVICTMNTKGTGSDRKFVGRNRLDAATLDRFCLIDVPVDTSLEAGILGITESIDEIDLESGGIPSAYNWLATVRKYRVNYSRSHPDKIVSMRATRDGWKLAQAGLGLNHLINICITK